MSYTWTKGYMQTWRSGLCVFKYGTGGRFIANTIAGEKSCMDKVA
jgi:hypothetical protein